MGQYSIGEAISLFLEKSKWKQKVVEIRMRKEWEAIVGKMIARYTRNINVSGQTLTIYTDVAALKQELLFGKAQLISRINEYFDEKVVVEINVK